jgi:hypothetical protein
MKARTRELVEIGDKLFSKRSHVMNLWQAIAEQLYPERADFTKSLPQSELGPDLMTGAPIMARRDLADSISSMLRRRETVWMRARTLNEKVNEDTSARQFLDWLSNTMYRIMYEPRAGLVRATKQGDNDFSAFGQCVIEEGPNRDMSGLLYRNWHLRDVAWCEDEELRINVIHRNWSAEVNQLVRLFPKTVPSNVKNLNDKEPYKTIKCRHIIMPSDDYDLGTGKNKRKLPYVSIYVDTENDTILEEVPSAQKRYIIPRWATVSGSQYAHSPGAVIAYRDARLLQQITATLLEAGEKAVDPPSVGRSEAIQGGINLYAGGHTWIDAEYDEKLGDALTYLPIDTKGFNFGIEREKMVIDAITKALYLDRITVPYPEGDMTATEYRGRVEEYIRRALPLFEPMEVEYNGALCEETFTTLLQMNAFGAFDSMPQILRGQDIRWTFDSPLQSATERSKTQAFMDTCNLLRSAVDLDKTLVYDFNVRKGFRDAMIGTGASADWAVPKEEADKLRAQQQQVDQANMAQQAAQAAIAMKAQAGQAAQQVSQGQAAMQEAGIA